MPPKASARNAGKYTPDLPTELWEQVIIMALRPDYALDWTCLSSNIDVYYQAIAPPAGPNKYSSDFSAQKKTIRLVSRFWNSISCRIKSPWVSGPLTAGDETSFEGAERIDLLVWEFVTLPSFILLPKTLRVLNIGISDPYLPIFPDKLLANPSSLCALHLKTDDLEAASIFKAISASFPLLQTLSLELTSFSPGKLSLPNLQTLFLVRKPSSNISTHNLSEIFEEMDTWNLPKLQTFSLRSLLDMVPASLLRFFTANREHLQALCLRIVSIGQPLSFSLEEYPRLECLSTFVGVVSFPLLGTSRSLRHLIVGNLPRWRSNRSYFDGILDVLPPTATTLSLPLDSKSSDLSVDLHANDWAKIQRLERFCRENGIRIIDQNGILIRSLSSIFRDHFEPRDTLPKVLTRFLRLRKAL